VLPYTPIATADPNQPARADVARISVNEAKAQVEAGQAIFVDVRSEISYDQLRIEGATLMPSNEVVERYDELPADKLVIFYCA
jgi:rhodanese-related sulfurtransferase